MDLLLYGADGRIEYDFVVAPGADPDAIRLAFEGHTELKVADSGDLIISTATGALRQTKPVIYQTAAGHRRLVRGRYAIRGDNEVVFALGAYDKSLPLIIDPVIAYSSYFGGAGNDHGNAIAVRAASASLHHVYITGSTTSTEIPNTTLRGAIYGQNEEGQPRVSSRTAQDVFVSKIAIADNGLAQVEYTTYLGGNSAVSEGTAIAVTAAGEVVVAGNTKNGTFVVTKDAYQTVGSGSGDDCFVSKLQADGRTLVYSTYLRGGGEDRCRALAVNPFGEAVVTGTTKPSGSLYNFPGGQDPETQAVLPTLTGAPRGLAEAFVVSLNADGKTLAYAKHLGGANDDHGNGIVIDENGIAHVVGTTKSTNIPGGPHQATNNGGEDGFILSVGPNGSLVRFNYYGGPSDDEANAIAIGPSATLHVAGKWASVPGYHLNGTYVARFAFDGSPIGLRAYLGHAGTVTGVAVDSNGSAWVSGSASSGDSLVGSEQREAAKAASGYTSQDGYLAKITYLTPDPADPDAPESRVDYSTFIGGQNADAVHGVAVDSRGYAYVVGTTESSDFPVSQKGLQRAHGGGADAFLRRTSGDGDRDGIPDSWETEGEGIDLDRNGVVELDLFAIGARPTRKDVFVEVDYLAYRDAGAIQHTHRPNSAPHGGTPLGVSALQKVIDAFDDAPVKPPPGCVDCVEGINLHFRGGASELDGVDEEIAETETNKAFSYNGSSGVEPRRLKWGDSGVMGACTDGFFGTAQDRAEPGCPKRKAWHEVAHYALFGHGTGPNEWLGVDGFAEAGGGNDLFMTIDIGSDRQEHINNVKGAAPYGGEANLVWADIQAHVFMHELGHNLGLEHGGGRKKIGENSLINCKPNYLSVMNYSYAYPTKATAPDGFLALARRVLDFSRKALPSLNEAALVEERGIKGTGTPAPEDKLPEWDAVFNVTSHTGYAKDFLAPADGPINWSHGLKKDPAGVPPICTNLRAGVS